MNSAPLSNTSGALARSMLKYAPTSEILSNLLEVLIRDSEQLDALSWSAEDEYTGPWTRGLNSYDAHKLFDMFIGRVEENKDKIRSARVMLILSSGAADVERVELLMRRKDLLTTKDFEAWCKQVPNIPLKMLLAFSGCTEDISKRIHDTEITPAVLDIISTSNSQVAWEALSVHPDLDASTACWLLEKAQTEEKQDQSLGRWPGSIGGAADLVANRTDIVQVFSRTKAAYTSEQLEESVIKLCSLVEDMFGVARFYVDGGRVGKLLGRLCEEDLRVDGGTVPNGILYACSKERALLGRICLKQTLSAENCEVLEGLLKNIAIKHLEDYMQGTSSEAGRQAVNFWQQSLVQLSRQAACPKKVLRDIFLPTLRPEAVARLLNESAEAWEIAFSLLKDGGTLSAGDIVDASVSLAAKQ